MKALLWGWLRWLAGRPTMTYDETADTYELDSGREVRLVAAVHPLSSDHPFTDDERLEIASEMISRWMRWADQVKPQAARDWSH